ARLLYSLWHAAEGEECIEDDAAHAADLFGRTHQYRLDAAPHLAQALSLADESRADSACAGGAASNALRGCADAAAGLSSGAGTSPRGVDVDGMCAARLAHESRERTGHRGGASQSGAAGVALARAQIPAHYPSALHCGGPGAAGDSAARNPAGICAGWS